LRDGVDAAWLLPAREFLLTPSFTIIAKMFDGAADEKWLASLRRVNYLGNMCLVLQMDRSLSDTYWLNVNDPGFPFVGVIEHTNFDPPENYDGKHIVFISRYLATQDPVWSFGDKEYLDFAIEHLQRMFPEFNESWVKEFPGRSVETPPLMVGQIPPPCAAGLMVLFSCFSISAQAFQRLP
jgi:hypothetical protein